MHSEHTAIRELLVKEKNLLIEELSGIAEMNPTVPGDWLARDTEISAEPIADENEFADVIEERLLNQSQQDVLERRLRDVEHAIEKIDNKTFGVCEIGACPIEEDRLGANPAARTCKAHMNEESQLSL